MKFFSLMEPKHKRSEIQTQVMNIIAILDILCYMLFFMRLFRSCFFKGQAKKNWHFLQFFFKFDNYLPNLSTFFIFWSKKQSTITLELELNITEYLDRQLSQRQIVMDFLENMNFNQRAFSVDLNRNSLCKFTSYQ